METIDISIAPDGSLSYKVAGIKGGRCKDATKIIDSLSSKVLETKKTGEFCEIDTQQGQQTKS